MDRQIDIMGIVNLTDNSYFADYKGGTVSIYNNEREEDVYLEVVK